MSLRVQVRPRWDRLIRFSRSALRRAWARHAPRSFVILARPSPHELGDAGEELAARRLAREGFELLGRRVHTPQAEVDLWALRDGISWVVEVKSGRCERLPGPRGDSGPQRWDLRWRPGLSLDLAQRERLGRAARYLARRTERPGKIALIEVLVDARARRVEVLAPLELAT